MRNFLSRNQVPYVWLDPERDDQAVELLQKFGLNDSKLPAVLFQDGTSLVQPQEEQLAQKSACVPRRSRTSTTWSWPAPAWPASPPPCMALQRDCKLWSSKRKLQEDRPGAARRLRTTSAFPPASAVNASRVRAYDQARRFGAEFITQRATGIVGEGQYRQVRLATGAEVSCRVSLVAVGVCYTRIAAPGIERLTGSGVYYGASLAEAQSCKDEDRLHCGGSQFGGPGGHAHLPGAPNR